MKNVILEIYEDIKSVVRKMATKTVDSTTLNLYVLSRNIFIERYEINTAILKTLKYKIERKEENFITGYVYTTLTDEKKLRRYFHGIPPSDIKSWREEKDGIIRWIKKSQHLFGLFTHLSVKRDYEKFAYFIWRKQKIEGIPAFDFFKLAIIKEGGIKNIKIKMLEKFHNNLSKELSKTKTFIINK